MASGAYVTATVDARPSVFELVSQQSFHHALQPAIHHVVKVK